MAARDPNPGERVSPSHVALLRGINVGGRRIVPMADLAAIFEQAGCENVATYIQSGNVVLSASPSLAKQLPTLIPQGIGERFGFEPVVIVRTRRQMAAIAGGHPFLAPGVDHVALHVGFLAATPAKQQASQLDPDRSPGDRFVVRGAEIYFHLPGGMGRTKLTSAWLDSTLKTTCTIRNWATVQRLAGMLGVG